MKERETPSQNIAFLGIMSGVSVVLTLISSFFPFFTIATIFVLPVVSALGTRLTKTKYSIPFLLATSVIMLGASSFNLTETLFYLLPALLCGGLYGMLARAKTPTTYTILAVSFLSLGLNYLSVPIIKGLSGINPIEATIVLLKLNEKENVLIAFPSLLLALGLIQTVLSHFLIVLFHGRLDIREDHQSYLMDGIGTLSFGIIGISAGLFLLELGYICFVASAFLLSMCIYDSVCLKSKILFILLGVFLIIGIFIVAFVSPLLETRKAILLGNYYPIVAGLLLILFSIKKNGHRAK